MKSRILAGLDIGSSKITTLIAQVGQEQVTQETTINIVGVATSESRGVKKGQIVDIEDAVESTIESVEAAERMAGYNLDRAYISVGGAHVASQNSTGVVAVSDPDGEIAPDDVERVIESARAISLPASRDIIHVLPREFIVDGEPGVRDPIGMNGVRLEVDTHLVTASAPALKNLTRTVNEVGVHIEDVVFSGLASSFATLSRTEKELGCVLVDIGSGTTSIAAFVDGSLSYSGSIPIGARNVTNDLAIGLRVSLEKAEKIKVMLSAPRKKDEDKKQDQIDIEEEGTGEMKKVSKRTLTEGIIKPRLNEIFTMVKMDLERSGLINKIPSGAIITGGGAMTVGTYESASRVLGLKPRIAVPGGVGGLTDGILTPAFSTAIGLILYGAQSEKSYGTRALQQPTRNMKVPGNQTFSKLIHFVKDLLP